MKKILGIVINWFFKFFKINNEKIIFESGRDLIDGNVKAVYDYIIENNINEFKIIWLINKNCDISMLRKGDYAYYRTLRGLYHQATSKYWIRSQSIGSILKKKKNQIYIQLWHGNGVMKKMGYDVTVSKERPVIEHAREWDYYIANAKYDAKVIRSSTGYNKEIKILGMACIDNVLKNAQNKDFKQNVLKKLGIEKKAKNKKIVMYAPTFRDFDLEKKTVDVPITGLANLKDYIVLVRLHPLVRNKVDLTIFDHNNIINACDYPDSSELLSIADILITDYSSIIHEFSPLKKPSIFYAYDYDKYVDLRGGFDLDYKKELPGPICYNEQELIKTLKNIDKIAEKYKPNLEAFNKKYNYLADGNASKRFVNELIEGKFN